jgi:hypothetical protein
LTGVVQLLVELTSIGQDEVAVSLKVHPYSVILSQDCDLEQDMKARCKENTSDKIVPAVLFCEVFLAESIRNPKAEDYEMNSKFWQKIKQNKDERYHFLQRVESECDSFGEGIPELCIDFKRFFTVPTDELYKRIEIGESRRRCILESPYLEHLSSRFAYYLSRVALPQDHASE